MVQNEAEPVPATMQCPHIVSGGRCAESGAVRRHPEIGHTLLMDCPKHGIVQFNEDVYAKDVRGLMPS